MAGNENSKQIQYVVDAFKALGIEPGDKDLGWYTVSVGDNAEVVSVNRTALYELAQIALGHGPLAAERRTVNCRCSVAPVLDEPGPELDDLAFPPGVWVAFTEEFRSGGWHLTVDSLYDSELNALRAAVKIKGQTLHIEYGANVTEMIGEYASLRVAE